MRGVWKNFIPAIRLQRIYIPFDIKVYDEFICDLNQNN